MAKRRHGSAVQDSGENPKCRSGSQGPERSRGDPEGGGQIPVMHPANMAWFGDFLCQKRRCSIFPKVRYLRLASVGEDFLIFWNSLGCGPAQNWSFKYEHWRHVEFILVYESTGDDSSCWESCSFKIPQPPHATRQKNVDTVQDLVQRLICFVCRMVFIVFHCSSRFVSCFSQCFGSELAASQLTDLGIPRSPDYVLAVPWWNRCIVTRVWVSVVAVCFGHCTALFPCSSKIANYCELCTRSIGVSAFSSFERCVIVIYCNDLTGSYWSTPRIGGFLVLKMTSHIQISPSPWIFVRPLVHHRSRFGEFFGRPQMTC